MTAAQAAEGFSQLRMPLGVSGVSAASRLAQARAAGPAREATLAARQHLQDGRRRGRRARARARTPSSPGGNLAASLSYGDVTPGRRRHRDLGLRRPRRRLRPPDDVLRRRPRCRLHPADALYIQEESLGAPFKVANLGAPVGTITDDHLTGITGIFGAAPGHRPRSPPTVTLRAAAPAPARARSRSEQFTAGHRFYENLLNHDARHRRRHTKGSELQTWTIAGHQHGRPPFTLTSPNRYASQTDITWESAWAGGRHRLPAEPGARASTFTGVDIDSARHQDSSTYALTRLEQRVGGRWVTVGKGAPVRRPRPAARCACARSCLDGTTDEDGRRSAVDVPARTQGSMGRHVRHRRRHRDMFDDEAFSEFYYGDGPDAVASIRKMLADADPQRPAVGQPRPRERQCLRRSCRPRSAPQDKVVTGMQTVKVLVR